MANQEHLDILKQGVEAWNQWREEHTDIKPDLREANLNGTVLINADLRGAILIRVSLKGTDLRGARFREANLSLADLSSAILQGADLKGAQLSMTTLKDADLRGADLRGADLTLANLSNATLFRATLGKAILSGATLSNADLGNADLSYATLLGATLSNAHLRATTIREADLQGVDLSEVNLYHADLQGADLSEANLSNANLSAVNLNGANLNGANLNGANLNGANLSETTLVETNLANATLTNCRIYGISVWNVQLEGAKQENLIITPRKEPTITVDNLKIAQFIYLLLNNAEIRDVIDTIARKAVLILGRFTPPRKAVLDALREALRTHGYVPILFDFDKPSSRNFTETVRTLAHLSRFIIADLTDPSSIPQELQAIIPTLAVPVQPLLLEGKREYAMFVDLLKRYDWVLPIHFYKDLEDLLASLDAKVIGPAEQKAQELTGSDACLGLSDTHTISP